MTEKRFEETYGEMGLFRVKDNKTGKCYKAILCGNPFTETDEPILDILNEIAEENEQLKERNNKRLQRLKNQRKQLEKQQEVIYGYKGDIKQLKKENEQLKKDINELKSIKKFAEHKGINIFKIDEAFDRCWGDNANLITENGKLKQLIKKLEKELYLAHIRSMFSTVKSFKGDVSKRYYYSEETDRLYDTANHYGQYNKILDKKEIAMLLNEYETMLNSDDVE